MRIGIDARFLTHPQMGGFKTYTENLVSALARVDADNEYVLYLDRTPAPDAPLPRTGNFSPCVVPMSWPWLGMPVREQVGLVRRSREDRVDALHAPCLTAPLGLQCPLLVTIHDMIWLEPRRFPHPRDSWSGRRWLMELYQRSVARIAARRAAAIITVSEFAKRGIVEQLGIEPERVAVTPEASSPAFRRVDDPGWTERVCGKYGVPSRFILALGSADPRKNVPMLVDAYALLPAALRERHRLVIVWTNTLFESDLASRVDRLGLRSAVRFLKEVPTQDLVALYNSAAVFAHPSLQEGFGLPLVEAMASGTPLVALDNSSVPEVTGGAALLCREPDARSLAEALMRVLTDAALAADLVRKGLERAAGFSWDKCARQTVAVYERVLGSGRRPRTELDSPAALGVEGGRK